MREHSTALRLARWAIRRARLRWRAIFAALLRPETSYCRCGSFARVAGAAGFPTLAYPTRFASRANIAAFRGLERACLECGEVILPERALAKPHTWVRIEEVPR